MSRAVTAERVAEIIAEVAGSSVELDTIAVGPGEVATARGHATLGTVTAEHAPRDDGLLAFRSTIPIDLSLTVKVGGGLHRYQADLEVPLGLVVRDTEPLALVVDVEPPVADDVGIRVRPGRGLRTKVIARVGDIDSEIRRRVVDIIEERVASPAAEAARRIDLVPIIDGRWRELLDRT